MFALEVNKKPAGDAVEIEEGNGDVRDYDIHAAAEVLFDKSTRCTYSVSSLSFKVQHTLYLVRYMQAPSRLYKSEVRGSVSRVKTLREQGLPHYTYVLQAEQRLPHATEEEATRSFPMERGPTAKYHVMDYLW